MNKRILKRIMSLVLVVVMAVSTMMVSAVPISAATANKNEYNYKITIKTGDMEQAGTSSRIDLFPYDCNGNRMNGIAFYGEKVIEEFGRNSTYVCTYTCENEIDNIGAAISTSRFFDNWNLEYIEAEYTDGPSTVTKRFQFNKWIVDSIAYRDPNPEKYCVFPENKTVSVSDVKYDFNIQTAGSDGESSDKISIKVNGEKGSTSWHNVGKIAKDKKGSCSFSDVYVGDIKSITVKKSGINGWYPEIIKITVAGKTTTIYGGRWLDDNKEVTLSVTDRVAKVNVQTGSGSGAGTDYGVAIKLIDQKGNSTGYVDLSNIHPKKNAFEKFDRATFYIQVPDNFRELSKIEIGYSGGGYGNDCWYLDYIDVTLDGKTKAFPYYGEICLWLKSENYILEPSGYLYKVTVKTSDKFLAGTDSDVYLHAYDKNNNKICPFYLDNDKNNFEQDDTDVFYIVSSKKIADIKIQCKDSVDYDWHLDYIQLDLINNDIAVESTKYKFNKCIESDYELYKPKSKEVLL